MVTSSPAKSKYAASSPAKSKYYRPELDVVRFLAFLSVFFAHNLPSTFGTLVSSSPVLFATSAALGFGLSLFFTLSAFLICELLLRERQTFGTIAVKQFYLRRILRIWPLYYLGLALGTVIALLPGSPRSDLVTIGWFGIFMGAWFIVVHGWILNPVFPLWSISVEEQFYVFAPWIVKYFDRKALYGLCVTLILAANGWIYYLGRVGADGNRIWANSFVQFECFGAGILLCLALRGRVPLLAASHRLALLAGAGLSWFIACYRLHVQFYPGHNPGSWALIGGYGLGALGSVMILVAFMGVNPKFLPGWAIYLGRVSFGLYVYHEFALYIAAKIVHKFFESSAGLSGPMMICRAVGLKSVLPLGLTILFAAVSYHYFESPFLKMKKRHAFIENQPISG